MFFKHFKLIESNPNSISLKCLKNMKNVYQDENNVHLDENSVEWKPCINRESKSLELTIKWYSCHDINMKFLVIVKPPSIYQYHTCFFTLIIFFNPDSIENIPPLKDTTNNLFITMDISKDHKIIVHTGNGSVMLFRKCGDIFYYFNTSDHENSTNNRLYG